MIISPLLSTVRAGGKNPLIYASTNSSQVFTDPPNNESNHVAATSLSEKGEELQLDYLWSHPIQLDRVGHPHESAHMLSGIFRGLICELVFLHHGNQCWLQLKIVYFNCRLSYCRVLLLDNKPPKVFHIIRALISLYFFFFWNILQSVSLIRHISGFYTGGPSQIL